MSRLHVALLRDPQWKTFEERVPDPATAAPDPVTFADGPAAGDRDLREFATTAASTVIARLLGRERLEWRRAVEGVRVALEALEHASDASGPLHPAELAAEISEMVSGVMAAAASESLAAADSARAEARATIEELESRLAQLQSDSQQKLTQALARQQEELALRLRVEEARAESERIHEEVVAAYEARLDAARLHAEQERLRFAAVHDQLATCLDQAMLLIHGDERVARGTVLPPASLTHTLERAARSQNTAPSEDSGLRTSNSITPREADARPIQNLTLLPPRISVDVAPEIVQAIQQSLKETEGAYWADIAAKTPLEAVALLTANLRVTRAQLAARFANRGDVVATLFENQLLAELNAHGDTSYGRHLSISVRELYPVQGSAAIASRVA